MDALMPNNRLMLDML